MSRPRCDYQFKELEWERRERLAKKKGNKQMNPGDYTMLLEAFDLLKKISHQLDDVIIRLPAPPPRDLGRNPDNVCDQSAYKNPVEGTNDGEVLKVNMPIEDFKHPTAYRSVPTKTSDGTNG